WFEQSQEQKHEQLHRRPMFLRQSLA
ncbi:hypothetical protein D031_0246B, partial [Vibrio parahaemolyticus VP-48]